MGAKNELVCVVPRSIFSPNRSMTAKTEELNCKIQSIKPNARGFRSFRNYRTRILIFYGKLDLYPS